jgi:hypothetical protein
MQGQTKTSTCWLSTFQRLHMLDQDKLLQIMFDLGFPTDGRRVRSQYEGATTSVR